jgi:hypothetical protein
MSEKKTNNDFNAAELTQSVGRHGQDIVDVQKRLKVLENKFGDNIKIADTLCEASKQAVKMKEMIKSIISELLDKDPEIKNRVDNLVKGVDRDSVKCFYKKFGGLIFNGIIFILGSTVVLLFQYFSKKLGL